jgi:uncharacterized protein YcfL
MKRIIIVVALASLTLTGCSRHYAITLNNGTQFVTSSKPRLKGGSYYFKDASGQEQSISQGRVREIAPASRASAENPFKLGK